MMRHSLQNVLVLEDDAKFLHKDWKSLPSDYDTGSLTSKGGN